jgi:NAD(P)-dependent dehydrogenase (short-subunit alcohol dehydrogenase family)
MMSQVWLITGSSRGLGRAFAEAALASGFQVAATARNTEDLAELKDKYGDLVLPLSLNVTSETQAREAVQATIRTFGKLDVLLNNAGYGNVAPIEDFRAQIETNLFGVIILTKAVLPYFRDQGSGHIIQVTSIAGRIGPIGRAPYAAAKWGVGGFFRDARERSRAPRRQGHHRRTGGFRTDFAGSSTELREGRPEYDATVGNTARFQRDYNGKQPDEGCSGLVEARLG